MQPKHKLAKWMRALKAKGVDIDEWRRFHEGWPKAWNAQETLVPVVDVFYHTRDTGKIEDRRLVGLVLKNLAWGESYTALNKLYEFKQACWPLEMDAYTERPQPQELQAYFYKPVPDTDLRRHVCSLWRDLADLYNEPHDLVKMHRAVIGLAKLHRRDYGDDISGTKDRVLRRIRGCFPRPRLT